MRNFILFSITCIYFLHHCISTSIDMILNYIIIYWVILIYIKYPMALRASPATVPGDGWRGGGVDGWYSKGNRNKLVSKTEFDNGFIVRASRMALPSARSSDSESGNCVKSLGKHLQENVEKPNITECLFFQKSASKKCRKLYPKGTKMEPRRSKRVPKEGPGVQEAANTEPMGSKSQKK